MLRALLQISAGLIMATLTACMPSSWILMAARSESDLLNVYSTRTKVEKKLGPPAMERAVPPTPLSAFKFPVRESRENYSERNFLHGSEGSIGLDPRQSHVIVTHCRYVLKGKVVPRGYAGDASAVGLMTFGISEIIAIPMAIGQLAPDSTIENTFDVWYSEDGRLLAYTWEWIPETEPPSPQASESASADQPRTGT